jgi:hypothetical protein
MKVALLASGPSLKLLWDEALAAKYDRILAVNRAGWLFPCHWLAFVDSAILKGLPANRHPSLGYITHKNHNLPEGARRLPLTWYSKELKAVPPLVQTDMGDDACAYTFPSALLAADSLANSTGYQQGSIDIYGFDAVTAADCADWTQPGSHGAGRWYIELRWLHHVWPRLTSRVTHHGNAPHVVRDYLSGHGAWEDVLAHYKAPEAQMGMQRPITA